MASILDKIIGAAFSLAGKSSLTASSGKTGVGESLVATATSVAHIDLLIGPRRQRRGKGVRNALVNNKDGSPTLLAVLAPTLFGENPTHPLQQGADQERQAGRADVGPGAIWRRQAGRPIAVRPKA